MISALLASAALTAAAPQPAYTQCLVSGDSIALGIGQALNRMFGPACRILARVGAPSAEIADRTPAGQYGTVFISAGSNDPTNRYLAYNLSVMRSKIRSRKIVWILPYNRTAAVTVNETARRYGDLVLDLWYFPSRGDRLHPASYSSIAMAVAH